ncbi:MAG: phenylacetic acid degradation protein PaaN [Georgfuchsia sp.]
MTQAQTHSLFDKHIATLRKATAAAESRIGWSPYPDTPTARGKQALEAARVAFDAYRDASFYLDQPGVVGRVGDERSPYGLPLNISYPQCGADALIMASENALPAWVSAGPDTRIGVCLEILDRLHKSGIEIAHAVMHTTGQPFALAYQNGLAGALDRGLEAVAVAYRAMKQVPSYMLCEKPRSNHPVLKVEKCYTITPRGIALVVGSPSEPTWAGWPGMFASLATGNPVIVNPHPAAVLPLAMTVAVARQVIKEAGFEPNLISLLVDDASASTATIVGLRPEIRIIDCAGETDTANWLEENIHHAAIFSLKAGTNCVVVDSITDYKGMLRNIAFSLCLNSGQQAATPRLILVSREGVRTPEGKVSAEQFERDLVFAMGKLMENEARAVDILGAIQSPALLDEIVARRDAVDGEDGRLLRDTTRIEHPHWPAALVATPLLLKQTLDDGNRFLDGTHGPLAFVTETETATEALASAERIMRDKGALNFSVYSDREPLLQLAEDIAARVGVALSINLTGNLPLSQTEAFSDFYATGENPSATCSLVDVAFVARRFFVGQTRRQTG